MAGVLRDDGLDVEIHDDHFAPDAKDEEWLSAVGRKQWIVVTRDERIRYRAAAKQAIRRAKVRAFVLTAQGNLRAEMLADNFLKGLTKVRRTISEQNPPFIARVSRSGEIILSISDFVYSALKSEEPDRAFAFSEWKSPGIFQHPSPVTAKLPFRRMRLYAIDYIDDAHDSAELEFSREPEAILLCDRRKILRRCEGAIAAGMNEKRTPMICSP